MALADRTTWEVRPTGNASNGSGFDPSVATPGTDFSQQDTPAVTIDNSTITTSITANVITFTAGYTPSAADDGNVVHMLTGTNVTAGFYTIVSHTPTTWTVTGAVNLPTAGTTTNATGRMGGAVATLITIQNVLVDGNIVYVRDPGPGYTTPTQWAPNGASVDGKFITIIGYTNTRTDNGLAKLTASANILLFLAGPQTIVRNFKFDGANIADRGFETGIDCYAENIWVTRFNLSGIRIFNEGTRIRRCLADHTIDGITVGTGCIATECEAHHCSEGGFVCTNGTGVFIDCIAHDNSGSGFFQFGDDGPVLWGCTSNANTVDGFRLDTARIDTTEVVDCLFTNNGGFGIRSTAHNYALPVSAPMVVFFRNNAYFGNTGGNYSQLPQGQNDVILTADPYTNAAGGDYSLNGAVGGGLLALGAGVPGGFGLLGSGALASIGHRDIGAVQTLGSGAAASSTTTMRNLWRELTNERFVPGDPTSAIPDATVDLWVDFGLQELNRRIHYHIAETTIAISAGQQEYTVPSDYVQDVFLRFDTRRVLQKGDIERWRNRGEDWQGESGEPKEYGTYANKIVLRPTPDAQAVANSPTLTLRYVSTPPSLTTNGPEQLGSQDYRIAVIYGAYLFSVCYPESLVAQQRLQALKAEFEDSVKAITMEYDRRSLSP